MRLLFTILTIGLAFSCSKNILNIRKIYEIDELAASGFASDDKVIKVHMTDGKLAVLKDWIVDNDAEEISGKGYIFSSRSRSRLNKRAQKWELPFNECVLIETNSYEGYRTMNTGTVMSMGLSALTLPCVFDPKSCFGSCPTFYLHDKDSMIIQAEGFSSSITKSMEAQDIDWLPAYDGQREVKVELKNEAWETHYLRKVDLLAVPRSLNEQVLFSGDKAFTISQVMPLVGAPSNSIFEKLQFKDGLEYLSPSDESDLITRESIILDFEPTKAKNLGIVITQRQSFMTTFLFYQSLAYMGSGVGELMAAYENASPLIRDAQNNMYDILGSVEVSAWINGEWKLVGEVEEQGPIVTDTHLIPIKHDGKVEKVKLTMTKGLWKIDQVTMCAVHEEVSPLSIQPIEMLENGIPLQKELEVLNDPSRMLVNQPGASYTLRFVIPDKGPHSVFLRSQGYYTEWMRKDWLSEEDPEMVRMIIRKPRKWLKLMTPKYKMVESEMESMFWASKFGSHEN